MYPRERLVHFLDYMLRRIETHDLPVAKAKDEGERRTSGNEGIRARERKPNHSANQTVASTAKQKPRLNAASVSSGPCRDGCVIKTGERRRIARSW